MAIPDYQSLMLPSDGNEHEFSGAVEELAEGIGLSADVSSTLSL